MRPVAVCPMATYLIRRRVYLICRGGIYASRQGCALRGVYGGNDRIRRSVGRGLDLRAKSRLRRLRSETRLRAQTPPHIIKIKKFIGAAGVNTRPTIQNKRHAYPVTGNAAPFRRAACMPPLRIDQTPSQPKNGIVRRTATGRMHVGPYNARYTPYAPQTPRRLPRFFNRRAARDTAIFHFYFFIFHFR